MTEKLKEVGIDVGHRRVGRLMRENGVTFERTRKFKATTNSNRGSQYFSRNYQKILRQHRFNVSMSGKGHCYDNAAVETFFKTINAELIWRRSWVTRRQAEMATFEYINGFYNQRRWHSALDWESPVAFERKVA
jgi:putative transposase